MIIILHSFTNTNYCTILYKLLLLKVTFEVEHLQHGKGHQTGHRKYCEMNKSLISGFVCIAVFLLALLHARKLLHGAFGKILQFLQLDFHRLQLLCLAQLGEKH